MDNEEKKFVEMSEEELTEVMGGTRSFPSQRDYTPVKITCKKCGKTETVTRDKAAALYMKKTKCSCGGDLGYSKAVDNN